MRAKHIFSQFLAIIFVLGIAHVSYAQEYDDLYFTSKDRNMMKLPDEGPSAQLSDSQSLEESFSEEAYTDDYSAKNVNPEYIARYQSQSAQGEENPTYGAYWEPEEEQDVEYYPEEEVVAEQAPTIVNNYYGSSPYRYQPSRWSFRPSMMMGYNSFYGWQTGFGMSMTYGDPFFDPRFDPFYSPFYSPYSYNRFGYYDPWSDPFYCPPSYGYNRFSQRNAYLNGYYNGYYAGGGTRTVVVGNPRESYTAARQGRRGMVTRGTPRAAASGVTTRGQGLTTVGSEGTRTSNSNGRVARDYTATQNAYYDRSRRNRNASSSASNGRVASSNVRQGTSREYSATTNRSSYSTRTANRSSYGSTNRSSATGRSATSVTPRSTSTNRSTTNPRRYSTSSSGRSSSTYRSNSSGRSNRSFSSPSRSNSRNYSSPSRSNSYSSPARRSSGSSIQRSSGSSRSYTAPSRSSGRSSGGRSSSGTSSRSRRGN